MGKFEKKIAFDAPINRSILENSINQIANNGDEKSYFAKLHRKYTESAGEPVLEREYLIQLGKRIQMYWGTANPKHFIRTFSEVEQLLNSKDEKGKPAIGLAISIIDEDNLQKVRLVIKPEFKAEDASVDKHSLKPFYLSRGLLEALLIYWKDYRFDPANLDTNQPVGIEFCIGKQTPDQELYDYYIIVQVVDLCHQRMVAMEYLPVSVPPLSDFQLYIP